MAVKSEESISHMCGWVIGNIVIAVERLYSCMISGALLPSTLWYREPDWDSCLVLILEK